MSEELRPFAIDVPDDVPATRAGRACRPASPCTPCEIVPPVSDRVELQLTNIVHRNTHEQGGHFVAFEVPGTFVADIRAVARRGRRREHPSPSVGYQAEPARGPEHPIPGASPGRPGGPRLDRIGNGTNVGA